MQINDITPQEEVGLDWKECVRLGEIFQERVEEVHWLTTDTGKTFEVNKRG